MDRKKLAGLISVIFDEFEDDDDFVTAIAATRHSSSSKISLCLIKNRERHFRLGHLTMDMEDWIGRYLDTDFHRRFRMQKDTYRELVKVIRPHYPVKLRHGNVPPVDCPKAVLIALYYLAHELSMDDVADKFGVTGSTVHKEVHRIVDLA